MYGERPYTLLRQIQAKTVAAYNRSDWRTQPIIEIGEPLLEVDPQICFPFYCRKMGLTDCSRLWLRESVIERLLIARDFLYSFGVELIVYDGWRPFQLQEDLFWLYLKQFTALEYNLQDYFFQAETPKDIQYFFEALPTKTQRALFEANRVYVSWPTKEPACPSPHLTGGAVDVWLYRHEQPVDLGVPFDWMGPESGAFYHLLDERKCFNGNDEQISEDRMMLILAMNKAGFSCYPEEVWHFNSGNQMHSLVSGEIACYSAIQP